MAKKEDKPDEPADPKPRSSKSEFLYTVLSTEIKEVLSHYSGERKMEMLEHFSAYFEEWRDYFQTGNIAPLDKTTQREQELLKKYRAGFKPYKDKRFERIYDLSTVLLTTGYYNEEEFKALPKQETTLTLKEVLTTSIYMASTLDEWMDNAYLENDPETEADTNTPEKEENDKDMTEARQLLAIHYLLKSTLGIEHRSHGDVSAYTRFAHLLLGKKINKLQDSGIYKKYKKLPYYNKGPQLIKDLEYIKPFFQALNLQKALDLIEKEIKDTRDDSEA